MSSLVHGMNERFVFHEKKHDSLQVPIFVKLQIIVTVSIFLPMLIFLLGASACAWALLPTSMRLLGASLSKGVVADEPSKISKLRFTSSYLNHNNLLNFVPMTFLRTTRRLDNI